MQQKFQENPGATLIFCPLVHAQFSPFFQENPDSCSHGRGKPENARAVVASDSDD